MTVELIFFIGSALLMSILLINKYLHVRKGQSLIFAKLAEGADPHVYKAAFHVRGFLGQFNKHNFLLIFNRALHGFYSLVQIALEFLRHMSSLFLHKVRRKKEILKSKGEASEYLKNVSEFKEKQIVEAGEDRKIIDSVVK